MKFCSKFRHLSTGRLSYGHYRSSVMSVKRLHPLFLMCAFIALFTAGCHLLFKPNELSVAEQSQWRRVELARKVCEANSLLREMQPTFKFMSRLRFVPEAKLVYCENFKMASSMMAEQLMAMRGANVSDLDNAHPYARHYFGLSNEEALNQLLDKNEDLVLALIVRDPLDRLWSAYNDKVRSNPSHPIWSRLQKSMRSPNATSPPLKDLDVYSEKLAPSFLEFALYVIKTSCNYTLPCDRSVLQQQKINLHWNPVHINCNFCAFPYNMIIKMETFEEDLALFNARTGLRIDGGHKVNVNGHSRKLTTVEKFQKELNETVLRQLIEIFEYDFRLFGYDPNVYLTYDKERV